MHPIAQILDQALNRLAPAISSRLEQTVQEAIAEADRKAKEPTDAMGYPIGYFESTSGSFANEPFDLPVDLPPEKRESW